VGQGAGPLGRVDEVEGLALVDAEVPVVPAVAVVALVVGAAAEVVGDVVLWLLLPQPAAMTARPITTIHSFGVLDGRMATT
jgi:hypothetical protein